MTLGAPIPAVASPHYAREGSTDVGGRGKGATAITSNAERSVSHGGRATRQRPAPSLQLRSLVSVTERDAPQLSPFPRLTDSYFIGGGYEGGGGGSG